MEPTMNYATQRYRSGLYSGKKLINLKRFLILGMIMTSSLFVSNLYAQKDGKPFSFGFGIEGGGILGDKNFKEVFSSEFGMSLRFSVKAGPGYATFTPGGMLVIPKSVDEDEVKVGTHVPLKLGYKYIIADKFFVMAEGGYSFYTIYTADSDAESVDDMTKERYSGFTYAPSVGLNLGKFELGLRYETTILKKNVDVKPGLLALRIGFNF
jgi:hypothetical protein